MKKEVAKFRDLSEAEKADREFYRKLTGQERLDILLELSKQDLSAQAREFFELLNSLGVDYGTDTSRLFFSAFDPHVIL